MTNIDDPLISPAEAARVIGVNKSTLSRQIKAGAVRSHGGKVRLSEVLADRAANIDLTRSLRHDGSIDQVEASPSGLTADDSAPVTACVASPGATLDATADSTIGDDGEDANATVLIDGVPVSYSEARALKESYLAQLKRLEYETKNGKLAPIAEMVADNRRILGSVCERLLALPGKWAGLVDREVLQTQTDDLYEALEEIHEQGAAAGRALAARDDAA